MSKSLDLLSLKIKLFFFPSLSRWQMILKLIITPKIKSWVGLQAFLSTSESCNIVPYKKFQASKGCFKELKRMSCKFHQKTGLIRILSILSFSFLSGSPR